MANEQSNYRLISTRERQGGGNSSGRGYHWSGAFLKRHPRAVR